MKVETTNTAALKGVEPRPQSDAALAGTPARMPAGNDHVQLSDLTDRFRTAASIWPQRQEYVARVGAAVGGGRYRIPAATLGAALINHSLGSHGAS